VPLLLLAALLVFVPGASAQRALTAADSAAIAQLVAERLDYLRGLKGGPRPLYFNAATSHPAWGPLVLTQYRGRAPSGFANTPTAQAYRVTLRSPASRDSLRFDLQLTDCNLPTPRPGEARKANTALRRYYAIFDRGAWTMPADRSPTRDHDLTC
jgi:hypothetical protein